MVGRVWDSPLVRWGAPLAWMGLIFYLSAQPKLPDLTGGHAEIQDIVGHFAVYAVLALLWRRALLAAGVNHPGKWALLIAFLYGLSDEYHQRFVPGRHPDPLDVATDLAGAAAALVLARCSRYYMTVTPRRRTGALK